MQRRWTIEQFLNWASAPDLKFDRDEANAR